MPQIKLNRLHLSNYKNLKEATVCPKELAAIVGTNNSGKSNFLEIFNLLNLLLQKGNEGREILAKRIKRSRFGSNHINPMKIEIDFEINTDNGIGLGYYSIQLSNDEKDKLLIEKESFFFKEEGKTGPTKKLFSRERSKLEIRNDSKDFREIATNQSAIEHIRSIFPNSEELPDSDLRFIAAPVLIAKTKTFKIHGSMDYNRAIRETYPTLNKLQESNDPSYQSFSITLMEILGLELFKVDKFSADIGEEKKTLFYSLAAFKDRKGVISFEDLSDGSQVIFLMLYNIFIKDYPIIVIDEPEIGLHPKAIKTFLDLFLTKQINKQIIFATHSPFILNIISPDLVYVSEQNEEGMFCIKHSSEFEDLRTTLASKYVQFGDLFADNFKLNFDTSLE